MFLPNSFIFVPVSVCSIVEIKFIRFAFKGKKGRVRKSQRLCSEWCVTNENLKHGGKKKLERLHYWLSISNIIDSLEVYRRF